METDIIGGIYMGYKTILVLSGIADKKSLKTYAYKPTLVSNTVNDIKRPLPWWHS
jgi:NagD protein